MKKYYLISVLAVVLLFAGCTGTGDTKSNGEHIGIDDDTEIKESSSQAPGDSQGIKIQHSTEVYVNGEKIAESDSDKEILVTYDSNGFSPNTLTVEKGDTVTWISNGPDMWVATDEHPTHTEYDGTSTSQHCEDSESDTFDSCSSQDTYSFTFDKKGEWDYHNHVLSSHGGTVIVE